MKNLLEKRVGLGEYLFFSFFLCCSFLLFGCLLSELVLSFKPHISKIFMKTYCNFILNFILWTSVLSLLYVYLENKIKIINFKKKDSSVKISFKSFGFLLRFPGLLSFNNSVLAGLCQYDNQTFSANQSIITSNCRERCQCHHINGAAVTICKPLCSVEEHPKCHPHSERLAEFQRSLNDTKCTCTKKRCVSGIKISNILFCH